MRCVAQRLSTSVRPSSSASGPAIATSDFKYDLPEELIAQEAAEPRDAARLLVALPQDGALDTSFSQLPSLLPPRAHLVLNESAVFSARLRAKPEAGADTADAAEVMLLGPEPADHDASTALLLPAAGQVWRAMVRMPLTTAGQRLLLVGGADGAQPSSSSSGGVILRVDEIFGEWNEEGEGDGVEAAVRFEEVGASEAVDSSLAALFDAYGETPLPPYIRRAANECDRERYQAVFAAAERAGSVAAPTAGLHFTRRLLAQLDAKGVRTSRLALHVGAGTFKPVVAPTLDAHTMHSERFCVPAETLEEIAASCREGAPIVPVGTTSTRVLESIYWLGLPLVRDGEDSSRSVPSAGADAAAAPGAAMELGHLDQWAGVRSGGASIDGGATVDGGALPPTAEVLEALAASARSGGFSAVGGTTSLCIAPGYGFRVADALVTNFHAPDSTLMCLVSAMLGGTERIHEVYRHAVAERYRFLSYGDACLLFNHEREPTLALAAAIAANAAAPNADSEPRGGGPSGAAPDDGAAGAGVEAAAEGGGRRARLRAALASGDSASVGGSDGGVVVSMPQSGERVRRVLLHSCCAPCSGAMQEAMVEAGHEVTVFFYNPNIHPKKEYDLRKEENKRYAAKLGVPFIDLDGDVDEWYRRAKGMEFCPERGDRCTMCFDMRLERTALYAYEHGFDSFTTTNATSRWKDEAQVNGSGVKAAKKYPGVEYWLSNWQTAEMTQRKYRINAEERFYKQEYCGCSYSLRDSNHFRAKQGQPPVQIGDEMSFYSDPEVDEAEESVELVQEFFAQSEVFEKELKDTYAKRRKDGKRDNW